MIKIKRLDKIKKILKAYQQKENMVYPKALGAEEIALFILRAPQSDQAEFMELLSKNKIQKAINLIENFLELEENSLWEAMGAH